MVVGCRERKLCAGICRVVAIRFRLAIKEQRRRLPFLSRRYSNLILSNLLRNRSKIACFQFSLIAILFGTLPIIVGFLLPYRVQALFQYGVQFNISCKRAHAGRSLDAFHKTERKTVFPSLPTFPVSNLIFSGDLK